jgi:hypothetical protein
MYKIFVSFKYESIDIFLNCRNYDFMRENLNSYISLKQIFIIFSIIYF